ncbi:MAG: HigA family addiction module antitoxin [Rhizobiaceae bacterium]
MTNEPKSRRHPERSPVHPGAILREDVLPYVEIGKGEFAQALGISRQMLHGILVEKHPVTVEMAVRLGHVLGNGPNVWINLQKSFDLWHAQQRIDFDKLKTVHSGVAAE